MPLDATPTNPFLCPLCDEKITPDDPLWTSPINGTQAHYECGFRTIFGGANHLLKRCTCYGGLEPPDPPDLTRRQAAREAVIASLSAHSPKPVRRGTHADS